MTRQESCRQLSSGPRQSGTPPQRSRLSGGGCSAATASLRLRPYLSKKAASARAKQARAASEKPVSLLFSQFNTSESSPRAVDPHKTESARAKQGAGSLVRELPPRLLTGDPVLHLARPCHFFSQFSPSMSTVGEPREKHNPVQMIRATMLTLRRTAMCLVNRHS
jgi:hypothetical protein